MPFLESFIYRYATRNAVIPGPPECGVYLSRKEMDYEGKENYCESKIISKTDLRKVQGYQEKRQHQSNL